ncbi:antimicrobial response protein [Lithospermum erythrorhizon]|uniref:Antimicrobial response protein n=1 Tax=Lithospermum erythrorhizon TaxID=34254 RepID=A0AAV3PME2_LITER
MKQFDFISKTLGNVVPTDQGMKSIEVERRMTTSFVNKLKIYGRDAEKDDLLRKLLSENGEEHNEIEVISIIGIGGLGKTTLAKLVYNDKEVEDEFQNRICVCVSDTFEEIKVAQRILECIGVYHNKVDNLQTLHESIATSLNKQQFLLVLDGVWDEKLGKWDRLRTCLESTGASKCRILVTTRSEKEIGMEIAKKCNGLPLAAMTLGGLLLSKDTIEEWKLVLSSELWEMEEIGVE